MEGVTEPSSVVKSLSSRERLRPRVTGNGDEVPGTGAGGAGVSVGQSVVEVSRNNRDVCLVSVDGLGRRSVGSEGGRGGDRTSVGGCKRATMSNELILR